MAEANYADGPGLSDNSDYYSVNDISYDNNGNIKTLNRTLNDDWLDQMTYNYYPNSNRLKYIVDGGYYGAGEVDGYPNGTSNNYTYDQNGNMVYDGGKNLTISYNHFNLPQSVDFGGDNKIFYHYSATGAKLVKYKNVDGCTDEETHYIGNIVYNGDEIAYILTEEGRMVPYGTGADRKWLGEYYLKDHLGNTRAVISDANLGGQVDVLQYSSYYPFGLPFAMKDYGHANDEYTNNKYLYNGKELQDDMLNGSKLDWYDYGARMYDAQLGRWNRKDPLMEWHFNYSPYAYCYNNPINLIDPFGLDTTYIAPEPIDPAYVFYCRESDNEESESKGPGGVVMFIDGDSDGRESVGRETSWNRVWAVWDISVFLDLADALWRVNRFFRRKPQKPSNEKMAGKTIKKALETSDKEIVEKSTGNGVHPPEPLVYDYKVATRDSQIYVSNERRKGADGTTIYIYKYARVGDTHRSIRDSLDDWTDINGGYGE